MKQKFKEIAKAIEDYLNYNSRFECSVCKKELTREDKDKVCEKCGNWEHEIILICEVCCKQWKEISNEIKQKFWQNI